MGMWENPDNIPDGVALRAGAHHRVALLQRKQQERAGQQGREQAVEGVHRARGAQATER